MRKLLLLLISFIIFFLGTWIRLRSSFSRPLTTGEEIRIIASLKEQPYQTGSSQVFSLADIKVVTELFPSYNYGDRLEAVGRIKVYDSNRFKGLLSFFNKSFYLVYPDIRLLNGEDFSGLSREGWGLMLFKSITFLRRKFVRVFQELLPEPHAALVSGMVLGEKRHMSHAFYTALKQTGTLHIIVASGMNVAIVAGVVVHLMLKITSRKWAILAAVLGILFYTILAGGQAPVVRAAVMGIIAYLAAFLGRERDGGIALGVAVVIMLLIKPEYLVDIGFQLSVAATVGVIWLFPVIKRYILRYPASHRQANASRGGFDKLPFNLGEELGITLAAQFSTLPLIIFYFGKVSLVSPLTNMLIAPVVPVITIWGGLVGIVGLFWQGLARVLSWGAWLFLEYFVKIIELTSKFSGAVEMGSVSGWWVGVYYIALIILIRTMNQKSKIKKMSAKAS